MLDPDSRSLYTSALTPPPGMIFEEAIAATFSMDPVLLLEAPLHLALMTGATMSESDPLSIPILQAVRSYSERITVYVQKGRIQVPRNRPTPLFGLLEEMIVEVNSPRGGVFHPKMWAIRFCGPDKGNAMIRLLILTRNMTASRSWDLSLRLEGTIVEDKEKVVNEPLAHFFRTLPKLAPTRVNHARRKQSIRFSEYIHKVEWELPDGFDELAFYLPGTKKFDWHPPESDRMAVISPFCSDEVLRKLAGRTKSAEVLISTPELMVGLQEDTVGCFSQCWHLDEAAETEEGEEDEKTERAPSAGLHAKAYLFETARGRTHLVTGSANATSAALLDSNKNVEILVGLEGKRDKVGGINELLHKDGLGKYLVQFKYDGEESADTDTKRQEAERCIEGARLMLAEARLSLKCHKDSSDNDNLWTLILVGEIPRLEGIQTATAWPITVKEGSGASILGNNSGQINLGEFSTSSVTGLVAFELKSRHHPDPSVRFVMNLPIEGMSGERNSAILETVIRNQDGGFIKYLLLLLGDAAKNSDVAQGSGSGFDKWLSLLSSGEEAPLLEEMVRAYSKYPDKLREISHVVCELSYRDNANEVVPEKFLKLWEVFESALGERNA